MRKIKSIIILSVIVMTMFFSGCTNSGSNKKGAEGRQSYVENGSENQHSEYENESKAEGTQAESSENADGESLDKIDEISDLAGGGDGNEVSKETNQSIMPTTASGGLSVKEDTNAETKPTVPEAEKNMGNTAVSAGKTFVKTETETVTETVDYRYGVKKIITYKNKYNVYSDGSKETVSSSNSSKYDVSGYNATDQQLRAESDSKSAEYMSYYDEVLRLVNEIRAEVGAVPLTLDTTLCNAATMRAVEMNYSNKFSHTRPDGRSCFSVLGVYGISYGAAGENIAAGYQTPQKVVQGWKNSEGHYKNMINSSYKKLGVGLSKEETGGYAGYWVQLFTD